MDLGLAAKVRPCLVLSVPVAEQDRALVTAVAPILGASVLFDDQGRCFDIYLLHDRGASAVFAQRAATTGTGLKRVFLEKSDLFRREGLAFVLGVAGLAADLTRGTVGQRRRLGLDDVGGGGLGRGGGVLARCRELLTQGSCLGA